jgi:hypothetical protein
MISSPVKPPISQEKQGLTLTPSPEAGEATLAKRVAQNFSKRYSDAGITGVNISILECYRRAVALKTDNSMKYCFLLDVVSSLIDYTTTKSLGVQQSTFNTESEVLTRAKLYLGNVGLSQQESEAKIKLWLPLVKNVQRVLAEQGR